MPLNNTARNLMLNSLASSATYVSLHTADPGATGTSEVTGGSYARKAVTWDAAVSGAIDFTGTTSYTFDVPAGTVAYFGLWSAASAGTFYGGGALSASETFASAGQYVLTDVDISIA